MLTPVWARVLVERDTLKTKSGIIIPESAEKRNAPAQGVVVAVGRECEDWVRDLRGHRVIFGRHAGDWIKDGDREVYILQEEDILAVVEPDA
jgi:chaperonin GroES